MGLTLPEVVRALRRRYGAVVQKGRADPWELLVWENVGYLVTDARRAVAYRALERDVGLDPDDILRCDRKRLAKVISEGGILADHRAEKVRECARVAKKAGGVVKLRHVVLGKNVQDAHKLLCRFPSVGAPGADRILLLLHRKRTLAPDSNALRVMSRLGWIEETKSYAKTYDGARRKMERRLPSKWSELVAAHALLRAHGQSTCTRRAPACRACPLDASCPKRGLR